MNNTVASEQPIINELTSNNLNDYQQSPGYQFRMQQGINALQNSAAANGQLFSGATGKALTQYGQDYGTNDYQTYLANLQNQLTAVNNQLGAQNSVLGGTESAANTELAPYQNLINTGAGMTSGLGALGQSASQAEGQYQAGAANDTAGGMVASSNALNNTSGQLVGLAGAALGGYAGAGTAMGALGGAQMGAQLGSQIGSGAPITAPATTQAAYQGAGFQSPAQNQQPTYNNAAQPNTPQQGYIQPAQMPTAQYNGTNLANPTANFNLFRIQ